MIHQKIQSDGQAHSIHTVGQQVMGYIEFEDEYFEAVDSERRASIASDYDFYKPLNLYLSIPSEIISKASDELAIKLKSTRAAAKTNKSNLRRCINVVLANLLSNYDTHEEKYTGYCRNHQDYPATRYNPAKIKLLGVVAVVDGLDELEFIDTKKGWRKSSFGWKKSGDEYGRISRMRAKPHFVEMLSDTYNVSADCVERYNSPEIIILKNSNKKIVDYKDTLFTNVSRKFLTRYNGTLEDANITLDVSPQERELNDIYLSREFYSRVFSNSSFEQNGRFYGPWWQSLSKDFREDILIDGEPTVECDYTGQHVHILYSLKGINYFGIHGEGDDPYTTEVVGVENRKLNKKLFLCIGGCKKRSGALSSTCTWMKKRPEFLGIDHRSALDSFVSKHSVIEEYFYTQNSLTLTFLGSHISEFIISSMMKQGKRSASPTLRPSF